MTNPPLNSADDAQPAVAPGWSTRLGAHFSKSIREMHPIYFALVMATGIVSIALNLLHFTQLSLALFLVNLVAYPALILATLARLLFFFPMFRADLTNPKLLFSFFTFVAGSNVLGAQCFLRGYLTGALALWIIGTAAWVFLIYYSFCYLTFANTKPIDEIVNGGWLVSVVATQSVVVLGVLLAPGFGKYFPLALLALYGLWGVGVLLYMVLITFIIYRFFFYRLTAEEMLPPYWINMGATAISTLAGANLFQAASKVSFLSSLQPSMGAVSVVLWAWCTWWIPLLLALGYWRHVVYRVPLRYSPTYWSMVFPLGMYTAATLRLDTAMQLHPMEPLPPVFVWIAVAAWTVTMLGLLGGFLRALARP